MCGGDTKHNTATIAPTITTPVRGLGKDIIRILGLRGALGRFLGVRSVDYREKGTPHQPAGVLVCFSSSTDVFGVCFGLCSLHNV